VTNQQHIVLQYNENSELEPLPPIKLMTKGQEKLMLFFISGKSSQDGMVTLTCYPTAQVTLNHPTSSRNKNGLTLKAPGRFLRHAAAIEPQLNQATRLLLTTS
jgi:hypothetical protein